MKKSAIVTGAARGIGRAIAIALSAEGYAVVLNDLAEDADLASAVDEASKAGSTAVSFAGDISDLQIHEKLCDLACKQADLHCLVNNAGVSVATRGDLLDASAESFDRCMAVNCRGAFFLAQRASRLMLDARKKDDSEHRSIIFITSANAQAASIDRGEYCMSKTAASMAAKLFAVRLAGNGIGSYEIRPGLIKTAMTEPAKEKYDAMIDRGALPMPRWGEPQDVARAAIAVAGGNLAYAVGQALAVDGGLGIYRL